VQRFTWNSENKPKERSRLENEIQQKK